MVSSIKNLRKELHQNPELSGQEIETARRIVKFIQKHNDTRIIENIGGHSLAAIYEFENPGPVVMIRCELDALPIQEPNSFNYKSKNEGVSHKCGHDGHMAIVAGLIFWIKKQSFKKGEIILLFQSAEETGKGAKAILDDPKFDSISPDYIFALHNIPGEPLNSVITVESIFSPTVQSLIIHLEGKECHASEPENGTNPAMGVSQLIDKLSTLNNTDSSDASFALLTPVHISLGQKSYGISPGNGELHYTLRTWTEKNMELLKDRIVYFVNQVTTGENLEKSMKWIEYFPTTQNDIYCKDIIRKVAKKNGLIIKEREHPFKFGEDFGWFSRAHKVGMFGLGAGLDTPALHHSDYDFPEEILEAGMSMFEGLIEEILK